MSNGLMIINYAHVTRSILGMIRTVLAVKVHVHKPIIQGKFSEYLPGFSMSFSDMIPLGRFFIFRNLGHFPQKMPFQ